MQTLDELFGDIGLDDFKGLKVLDTKFYKKDRKIEIITECDYIISFRQLRKYEKKIEERFVLDVARILINYIGCAIQPKEIDKEDFIYRICEFYPGLIGVLKNCDFIFDEKKLTIELKSHGIDIINKTGVDKTIKELFKKSYGLDLEISFIEPKDCNSKKDDEVNYYIPDVSLFKAPVINNTQTEKESSENKKELCDEIILGTKKFKEIPAKLSTVNLESEKVAIEGNVFGIENRETRSGKILCSFAITDFSTSISVKFFVNKDRFEGIEKKLTNGIWVRVFGSVQYDKYTREMSLFATNIYKVEHLVRPDTAPEKRVELHLHTQMSAMDGVSSASELIKRAAKWGHKAIAITDHGVLQGYPEAFLTAKKNNIKIIYGIEGYLLDDTGIDKKDFNIKKYKTTHIIIWVKNYTGLKNLYKLVSLSNLEYFYKKPRMLKSLISKYREGLLISSACEAGDLYKAVVAGESDERLKEIADFYDYLEIQPVGNNNYMIAAGMARDIDHIREFNKKIVELGESLNKPIIATGDVHFLEPWDEVFRRILMAGQGFDDADNQAPLYFKSTDEMLDEFSYLGADKAYEVVVKNPNDIANLVEEIVPIPQETYPPSIEGAEEEIERLAKESASRLYGDPLPKIVQDRLQKELNSIIKNGFSVMYIIAQKLVAKSLSDGYLVGSRGSVGSSFVATMTGITEINPLPAHYLCTNCKHSEFVEISDACGCDLAPKDCPKCGKRMKGEGYDIPFETFLGFDGDKEPDIDLNFSGEYQPVVHKYTEELFGVGHVYRAGTIGTIADKTAYGFVKKYLESRNKVVSLAEVNRLVSGCAGVKRTTGQHPGGVIIVPADKEIYDFCPIQKPADAVDTNIITTHFDYHFIHGTLLKLDILGHDDPTVIRMLEDLTGIDAKEIPIGDPETMEIFHSTKPLGIKPQDIHCTIGSFAIPEFGTKFVRQMLIDTKPTTFAELIRISGLSHGTDVWLNNAQDLVKNGTANLSQVICTRDDIMLYLLDKGLEPKMAFTIMENVRKGKGLKPEFEEAMNEHNVPSWYIGSCKKIKYMFPKAHAAAYVMMAFRIAYFKVHYPKEFYATYFTVRGDDFDSDLMLHGKERVEKAIEEYEAKGNDATTKEKNVLSLLEICNEMYARGIKFLPFDLYESHATKFLIKEDGILPPLRALSGMGSVAADNIVKARNERPFATYEDLKLRGKASKTAIELLEANGCLAGIPKSSQFSLFEGMGF